MTDTRRKLAALPPEKLALVVRDMQRRMGELPGEPIAIVGLSCRLPGGPSPEAFWDLLSKGESGVREVPSTRWDIDEFYDPRPGTPGKMYTRYGAFIDEVACFDADFFRISPREAVSMDPQQRILLEVGWEALEQAGITADDGPDEVGVFVGIMHHDYSQLMLSTAAAGAHTGSGSGMSVAAGRIAHAFGFHGPAIAMDTACSSSLVALHLGVRSLRARECDAALVAGVNLILSPMTTIVECQMRMLAADGRCKAFDASADGFVRGEGCGAIVLKRLSDARRDRDPIIALVRGSAVNHDGSSSGLTVPNGKAQANVIRAALADGGVLPEQVELIEAHGTGTSLGDPIEIEALGAVFGARDHATPLKVGSVKTNIGHTESTAGIAGVIKAALALSRDHIPAHLHYETPNPNIRWAELPVRVVSEGEPWPRTGPRRFVGVSSFGFSGTNAHVVLEEAPRALTVASEPAPPGPYLLTLSAHDRTALSQRARDLAAHLRASEAELADVCASARRLRTHSHRAAIVAGDRREAIERLVRVSEGDHYAGALGCARGPSAPVGFLFTGHGSQYPGMGRVLFEREPVARAVFERAAKAAGDRLDEGLLDVMWRRPQLAPLLDHIEYAQPALYALQCAIAAVWASWGVEPALVTGHSLGEYAAAHVAGVFSFEDGLELVMARGQLMRTLPPLGGMMVAFCEPEALLPLLESEGQSLCVAAHNGPRNVVLSGPLEALEHAARWLADELGIETRQVRVDNAYHSAAIDPILEPFSRHAETIQAAPPRLRFVSALTGQQASSALAHAGYWTRHMRQPVRFHDAIGTMIEEGCRVFVEIGPKATLLGLASAVAAAHGHDDDGFRWLASQHPDANDPRPMLETAAALHVVGKALRFSEIDGPGRRRVPLPSYPFARERHWIADGQDADEGQAARTRSLHPLLGGRLRLAASDPRYEVQLGIDCPSYLRDHSVQGSALLPAAALIELGLAAGRELLDASSFELAEVEFLRPLALPETGRRTLQTHVSELDEGELELQVFALDTDGDEPRWTMAARARLRSTPEPPPPDPSSPNDAPSEPGEVLDVDEFYAHYEAGGLTYGPAFRTLVTLRSGEGSAHATLELPSGVRAEAYLLHPALLDGCLQSIGAALPQTDDRRPWVPAGVESFKLHRAGARALRCSLRVHDLTCGLERGRLRVDLELIDASGRPVASARGWQLARIEGPLVDAEPDLREWLYRVRWSPRPRTRPVAPLSHPGPEAVRERLLPELDALAGREELGGFGEVLAELDGYAVPAVIVALERLGWRSDDPLELAELEALDPRYLRFMRHAAGMLVADGLLIQDGERWRATPALASYDARARLEALARSSTGESAEQAMVQRCSAALAEVLSGRIEPLELLFPDGDLSEAERIYQDSPGSLTMNLQVQHSLEQIVEALPAHADLRVLELGGGTGGTTAHLLDVLPADRAEYVFSDISPHFVDYAKRKFAGTSGFSAKLLDLELELVLQGEPEHRYDVVVIANMLHATSDLRASLERVRRALAPGGVLLLIETTKARRWLDLTFGLTAGWWAFQDTPLRPEHPLLSSPQWCSLLDECGFEVECLAARDQDLDALEAAVFVARSRPSTAEPAAEHLLVLSKGDRYSQALLASARARRLRCTELRPAARALRIEPDQYGVDPVSRESWLELLDMIEADVSTPVGGIVHLWSLEFSEVDPLETDALDLVYAHGSASLLSLVQATLARQQSARPALCVVTRGALAPVSGGRQPGVLAGPLWGLARAIDAEHPELGCRLIDLDPERESFDACITECLHIVSGSSTAQTVAFRGPRRLVPGLARANLPDTVVAGAHPTLHGDATYLISGGLSGLGLFTARWAVDRGARHLVLLGRSAPSPAAEHALTELRQRGVSIAIERADVGDDRAMRGVFERLDGKPPLRGIFHSAGSLSDGLLRDQSPERFAGPYRAKVRGTLLLARLARDRPLDLFVLYSSAVALLGGTGQANHMAACTFEDLFAHYLRGQGLPASSINWGAWSELGAAAGDEVQARMRAMGLAAISPAEGYAAFDLLLQRPLAQVGVLAIDWAKVLEGPRVDASRPFLAELIASERARAGGSGESPQRHSELLEQLAGCTHGRALELVQAYLLEVVAQVLRHTGEARIEPETPLHDLGLDSLMAIELRNRIVGELEVELPIEEIVTGTSSTKLAGAITDRLVVKHLTSATPTPTETDVEFEEFSI